MRILDVNGDIVEKFHYDHSEKKFHIERSQDVEGYFDRNQRERSNQVSGWKGDFHKVASIPINLIDQWNKEFGCNVLLKENRHLLMMKINDRDYSKVRTKEGKV